LNTICLQDVRLLYGNAQDCIPEANTNQKCDMNMGSILRRYKDMGIWTWRTWAGVDMLICKAAHQQHFS